jgi:UDP-N-acetylglucosamine acyltransferase
MSRRGFSVETIQEIQDIYRIVFQRGLTLASSLQEIENRFPPSPHRDQIISFIKESEKGIIRGPYQSAPHKSE